MSSCFNHFHLVNTWHGLLDLLRHCSNRQTEKELAKEQLIWNQSILGIKDLEKTILELFIACNAAHLKSLMEDMKMTIQKDNLEDLQDLMESVKVSKCKLRTLTVSMPPAILSIRLSSLLSIAAP